MSGSTGKNGYSIKIRRRRKKKKNNTKRTNPFLLVFFIFIIVLGGASYTLYTNADTVMEWFSTNVHQQKKDVNIPQQPIFLYGVKIDGIDVGGMTYAQAQTFLADKINTDTNGSAVTIKSTDGSKSYTYSFEDFGIKFDVEQALDAAIQFGTVEEEFAWDFKALEQGRADFSVYSYNLPKIHSFVRAIGAENTVSAKNATCKRVGDGFDIQPAIVGYSVDSQQILTQTISLIDSRSFNQTIQFDIKTEQPKYTEDDFAYVNNQLSSFSSPYTGGDENRIGNLRNACEKINGIIIYPEEVFSTNDAFNPCTEENGWFSAPTIVGGKLEDSIGGGMCQVSSALYDAALYAELEIVERHNHSLKVGYAKYAFDATLAGDYLDLKFRNNTGYPICIESYLTASNVVVKIYGYNRFSSARTIELENKFIEDIPHGDFLVVNDPELPEGTENITVSQLVGKKYELYKNVYENGELKETIKINTSTYKPRNGEKHIGTKKADEPRAVSEEESKPTESEG